MRNKVLVLCFGISISMLFFSCKDENANGNEPAVAEIPQINYAVTAVHPHDTSSFTQGLEWHNGKLLEGTGMKGKSKLMWVNLTDGKADKLIKLGDDYFGEGVTLLNNKIYQITWQEQKCFVYDANTLKKIAEFNYEGEGWGLTNNGTELIMSNGSSDLVFRDPNNFKILKTITVSNNYGPLSNLNELEFVNGFIYANIWTDRYKKIVKIDANTGKVVGELNLDDILKKYAPNANESKIDVLNGIAYDSVQQRFFITGKYWPYLFELKLK